MREDINRMIDILSYCHIQWKRKIKIRLGLNVWLARCKSLEIYVEISVQIGYDNIYIICMG